MHEAVNRLQLRRAAGPDDLPHVLSKNGGSNFINVITNLFENFWWLKSDSLN